MLIKVRHNIEVAHRLYETKGKCEQIHGHSMWVTLFLEGTNASVNSHHDMAMYYTDQGMKPLEFGEIKKAFRAHLDEEFDHRLLLNAADPFAGPIWNIESMMPGTSKDDGTQASLRDGQVFLPGLQATHGDPTTENIALWIKNWAELQKLPVRRVEVWETSVNGVEV